MTATTTTGGIGTERRLLRGTGPDLGPLALRFSGADRTLLHVLDAQTRDRPTADWLVFDGRDHLTFGAARDRGHRVASALDGRGLAGSRVALLLRNQIEFMPLFLGALASCGVAVPMNPELRGRLLGMLLDRCDPQVVAVRTDLLPRLADLPGLGGVRLVVACGGGEVPGSVHDVPVVRLADLEAEGRPTPPAVRPKPSDLAVLMFTSGTSGGSKAAMWPHHYLYLASAMASDALGHTPDDVLSTPLQMCHIAGLQVFANSALHVGCTAHLKSAFSARSWWTEVAADGTTFAMLMGQMTAMILDAVPEAPEHRLSHVYVLPQPLDRVEFERRYRTTVVWQGWGMTEIFPHLPRRQRLEGVPADTIGPAPSWVDHGVVDAEDRMLGPGELGELVYRPLLPDAMTRGYFGDPATTAHAFRNFMFHTGDLGYYDERGHVHFVMRNQDAIRRRGENISAVELENVARSHPEVLDAAAYAVPSELGEHEVKLDLVLRGTPELDRVHDWLREQLPRYMVPRYLEARPDLPRTPSQRVEKYKLAAEGLDRPAVREFDLRRR